MIEKNPSNPNGLHYQCKTRGGAGSCPLYRVSYVEPRCSPKKDANVRILMLTKYGQFELIKMYRRYRPLFEVHYTDIFAKAFQEFRKKYAKLKKDSDLYVQFTNYNDNTLGRSIHNDPDHSDPAGVYGYPLKYVIDNPADIWYGNNASFLRVLRRKSNHYLNLQNLNYQDILTMVSKLGIVRPEDKGQRVGISLAESTLKKVKKLFPNRVTGPMWAEKAFFSIIQMRIEDDGEEPKVRSATEQSKLLMSLGYDVIMDEAKTDKRAVINEREPEQVIFLRPTAFTVEEVFYMKQNTGEAVKTSSDPDSLRRKLASLILAKLEDKIVSDNSYGTFWSKAGRRIKIEFTRPDSYYQNKKMGQKKHREDKLSSSYQPTIEMHTEWGKIKHSYGGGNTFEEIANDIYDTYLTLKEAGHASGFSETKEQYLAQQQKEKDDYFAAEIARKNSKAIEAWPELAELLKEVAAKLGTPVEKILAFAESSEGAKIDMSEFFGEGMRNLGSRFSHKEDTLGQFREFLDKSYAEAYDVPKEVIDQILGLLEKAIEQLHPDSQEFSLFWFNRLLSETE